ncbi:hypothetical protein HanPSC8_Chr09g0359781 [Helianthus annuus]|nr:hypothetical protein HanPSC8_Chr09g0359781 [Helianthus annuus]
MALIPICHTPTNGGNIGMRRSEWNLVWKAKASICSHLTSHKFII